MDPSRARQPRDMRTEDDRTGYRPSHIPRPAAAYPSRPPIPMQLAAPPRSHQYRSRPAYSNFQQPIPRRHDYPARDDDISPASTHRPQYTSRQNSGNRPQYAYQPKGRHLSHISALSVSQADSDSRPVSETFVTSPSLPSEAVSEMDEEEHYEPRSVPHSRGGSQGRRTKTTSPSRSRNNSAPTRGIEPQPSSDQAATMEALTHAIRQGLHTTASSAQPTTPKPVFEAPAVRMPFQGEPESPSSVYTDVTATKRFSAPLSAYQSHQHNNSQPLNAIPQESMEDDDQTFAQDLPTPMSTHPIINGEHIANQKAAGKGLRIDIGAVREAEARGSMTSLSDLIKRATRLASNLDRGKTASRLGYLDMFGGSTDKLGNMRSSTYSDVLDAFPPPATGTTTPNGRPSTVWPYGEKQHVGSKLSLGHFPETSEPQEKPRRTCCGLSPIAFVIVMIIVFLLVTAAVLVPVFLLVIVPNQHKTVNLANCHSTHACQNGGYSVTADNTCSCVCADGFTGADCSNEQDPECASATVTDGDTSYDNATIGTSVLSLLQGSQNTFSIPLNHTIILSQFAYNNLSCASENSLVDFGNRQPSARVKRFVITPGMMGTEPHLPMLNLPPSESKNKPRFVIVDGPGDVTEDLDLLPTHTLKPRQDATQSANGIVFATSGSAASPTATSTGSNPSNSTTSTNSTSPAATTINATQDELNFAATVVLYVLQSTAQISNAVSANQAILTFFQESNPVNQTVMVMGGKDTVQANFKTMQIEFSNGTVLGGK